MAAESHRSHEDYTVGWICALPLEMAAAKVMLDEIHEDLPLQLSDFNNYILGKIGDHNIVIACLPSGAYGIASAATVVTQLLSSFRSIRFGLIVGIGGGIPNNDVDIRRGDIVVSQPTNSYGGVVQYDHGKALGGGKFQRTGMLNRPPQILLTALSKLQANHLTDGGRVTDLIAEIQQKFPQQASNFARPAQDILYPPDYHHIHKHSKTCAACDQTKVVPRVSRGHDKPIVHYGLIASANQVVRDSRLRDRLGRELGAYCVEMEAAGIMNIYPCLVVRGISDYADSHKDKDWQGYASVAAAAYAKELLLCTSIGHIGQTQTVWETLSNSASKFQIPLDLTGIPAIEDFLGRHDELERLWSELQPAGSRKVVVLHGLGGIGKTQLAIRFARNYKNEFTAIFWLDGRSRETILQSLSSVLPRIPGRAQTPIPVNKEEVEQHARQTLRWLATPENSAWLLIFDNIDQNYPHDEGGYDIYEFFPGTDHGSILITSRLQSMSNIGQPILVQTLSFEAAIALLWQSMHLTNPEIATEEKADPDIKSLIDRLGGLPLAIVIAGAFMRETGTSISEYLQHYQRSWHELQSYAKAGRHYQQGNILETWLVSYHEIKKRDLDTAELLLFLAQFDRKDIWFELLKGGEHSSHRPTWFTNSLSNSLVFRGKMKTLIEFSLVEVNPQHYSYAMHPVVQDWCLDIARVRKDKTSSSFDELALVSVGQMALSSDEPVRGELTRRLLPHADYVYRRWQGDDLIDKIADRHALTGLGTLYYKQGKLQEAETMFQRALAVEYALGPEYTASSGTLNNLGLLYHRQGKWQEAELMFQRALAGAEKALVPDHECISWTLGLRNNLGFLYNDQGKLQEAETMYQRALAYESVLGPDHEAILNTVNSLGLLYHKQGKWQEAELMFQRALAGAEKALVLDHERILWTLGLRNNLGLLYFAQGKLQEAETMYQRALADESVLGPDHEAILDIVNNLGLLYHKQGKWQEAELMFQRALTGAEKAFAEKALVLDHECITGLLNNLAHLYKEQGKLQEAERFYQRALACCEKELGLDHTFTLRTSHNLGNVYKEQGKLQEAGTMYQRALAGHEKVLGPDHPYTLSIVSDIGYFYLEQGKLQEAQMLFQRALVGYKKVLGPDHDPYKRTHTALLLVNFHLGTLEQVKELALYLALYRETS